MKRSHLNVSSCKKCCNDNFEVRQKKTFRTGRSTQHPPVARRIAGSLRSLASVAPRMGVRDLGRSPNQHTMKLREFIASAILATVSVTSCLAFDYAKDIVVYEGAVGSTKVKITASERPFSRAAHKTTDLHNAGSEDNPDWKPATVDGKEVVGTDQTLPKDGLPQLSALTVWFGDQKVSVPAEHLHHIFLPHLDGSTFKDDYIDTRVAFSSDGKALYLSLGVGDGGGTSTYDMLIRADGTVTTKPIQRPEP
jgi:hypothetical protein